MRRHAEPALFLDDQLCFPLYAASRLVTRLYQPLLEPLEITYPQYVVLLSLWQYGNQTVSEIGTKTFLESSTLTPLLKKLEAKGLVLRIRRQNDERVVEISLTEKGNGLQQEAKGLPRQVIERTKCSSKQALELKTMLYRLLAQLDAEQEQ